MRVAGLGGDRRESGIVDQRADVGLAVPELGRDQAGSQEQLLERSPGREQLSERDLEVGLVVLFKRHVAQARFGAFDPGADLAAEQGGEIVEFVDAFFEDLQHSEEALVVHDGRRDRPVGGRHVQAMEMELLAEQREVSRLERVEIGEGGVFHLSPEAGDSGHHVGKLRPRAAEVFQDGFRFVRLASVEFAEDDVFERHVGEHEVRTCQGQRPRHSGRVRQVGTARLVIDSAHGEVSFSRVEQ